MLLNFKYPTNSYLILMYISADCLREIVYRCGIADRPGSYYDMQNDIEEELDTSSDEHTAAESKSCPDQGCRGRVGRGRFTRKCISQIIR